MSPARKIAILGGGGLRTPLLIHGLAAAREAIGAREIALYDVDSRRAHLMAQLGAEIEMGPRLVPQAALLDEIA